MDVLHAIHQFVPEGRGGSESYLHDVVLRQRALGLDAHVLTGTKHARPTVTVERADVDAIPVHRLHRDDLFFEHHAKMWHPGVERTISDLLSARKPKILHVHHWLRLTCNLIEIAARHGVPAVVTLHDHYTSCPRAFRQRPGEHGACLRPLSAESCTTCVPRHGHESAEEVAEGIELFADHYRAEIDGAAVALVAEASTADILSRTTGVPRDRYETLPLGYDARFVDLPKPTPPRAGEPLRFAYWGSLGRHKGVDVLLKAFGRLHGERPGRAELHVLGAADSDGLDAELRALAQDLPCTFHGAFDAAALARVAPHVGVFPSTCLETYGLVLDECFELGLPCVTSDLGALGERGKHGGLTTRAGDDGGLAAAMQRFVDEPGLWETLTAKLPPRPIGRDRHVSELSAIYERARHEARKTPRHRFVSPERRAQFLQRQRESALGAACRGQPPR